MLNAAPLLNNKGSFCFQECAQMCTIYIKLLLKLIMTLKF